MIKLFSFGVGVGKCAKPLHISLLFYYLVTLHHFILKYIPSSFTSVQNDYGSHLKTRIHTMSCQPLIFLLNPSTKLFHSLIILLGNRSITNVPLTPGRDKKMRHQKICISMSGQADDLISNSNEEITVLSDRHSHLYGSRELR